MPTRAVVINHTYHNGESVMKRLVATIVLAIALLTSGMAVTQSSLVGTAYADEGGSD